jgi:hypothetical protein
MAATMYISESNGTTPTVTQSVTSLNFGYSLTTAADLTNLTANLYPIPAATSLGRSFEKWVRFNMSTLGGSTYCYNFKVYCSSSLGASAEIRTNASSTTTTALTFPTSSGPSTLSRETTYYYNVVLSTVIPASNNVMISGTSSWLSGSSGFSDYVVFQLYASSSATVGQTVTLSFQYDEVA